MAELGQRPCGSSHCEQAVTRGALVLLVPGTFAEHNRAEAKACTQRTAVRVVHCRADVGAVPAEFQVGHGISRRLKAGLQPARDLIGVDAEEVGVGPPGGADDGCGGCGQSYLEVPAFGGAPWAGLRGLRVAHFEVEQLVRAEAAVGHTTGRRERSVRLDWLAVSAGAARCPTAGSKCRCSWRVGRGSTRWRCGRAEKVSDGSAAAARTGSAGWAEGSGTGPCTGSAGRADPSTGGADCSGGNGSERAPWAVECGAGVGGGCSVLAGIGGMCRAAPSSETSSAQRVPRKLRVGGRSEPWS